MSEATLQLLRFWYGTAAEYDSLSVKSANTLYILSNGAIYRGTIKIGVTATDLAGKVDRVTSATANHVAIFGNTGTLVDNNISIIGGTISGAGSSTELATTYAVVEAVKDASGVISGSYMTKISGGTTNNLVVIDSTGELVVDSNTSISTNVLDNDTTVPTGSAVKSYVDSAISNLGSVLTYKGQRSSLGGLPTDASVGDVYSISSSDDDDGKEYVCIVAGGEASNAVYEELGLTVNVSNKVTVVDGTADHIVTFVGGSSANNIKDSGKTVSTSVGNDNNTVPTSLAVRDYAVAKISGGTTGNLVVVSGGTTFAGSSVGINSGTLTNSTTTVPTDKTVKDYVDNKVVPPPANVQLIVPGYSDNMYFELEVYGDMAMTNQVVKYISEGTPSGNQISLGSIARVFDPSASGMVLLSSFNTGIPTRCAGRVVVINLSDVNVSDTSSYPDGVAYIKYTWYTKPSGTVTIQASSVFAYPAFTPTDPVVLGLYWQNA